MAPSMQASPFFSMQARPFFPATAASRADQVSLECENFRAPIGIARTELTDDADRLGANFLRHENRCLER
jgi:hypothetical protein